ncbi:hypothetical protein lerEdw1_011047, partial [Lerista edwardsae]
HSPTASKEVVHGAAEGEEGNVKRGRGKKDEEGEEEWRREELLQRSDVLRCLTHTFSHKLYSLLVGLQCVGKCDVKDNQNHLQPSKSSPLCFLYTYIDSPAWHVLWMVDVKSFIFPIIEDVCPGENVQKQALDTT